MARKSARAELASFVRETIEGEDRVEMGDLVETAIGKFQQDPAWVNAFLREQLYSIVYGIAQNVVARTRSGAVIVGSAIVSQSGARAIATAPRPRWQSWLEHDGSGYVRLPEMTREQLLAAADQREGRAQREASIAAFWRVLADHLNAGQRVADVFDDAQLDALLATLAPGAAPALPPGGTP